MRVDGKFYIGNDIPEGQGSVSALLNECYDLLEDLKIACLEDTSDDEDTNGDNDLEVKESSGDTNRDIKAAAAGETRGKEEQVSAATETTK